MKGTKCTVMISFQSLKLSTARSMKNLMTMTTPSPQFSNPCTLMFAMNMTVVQSLMPARSCNHPNNPLRWMYAGIFFHVHHCDVFLNYFLNFLIY